MEVNEGDAARKPRGFGRAMVDLFRELGYDEGQLHPDMFEWLFGLPSLRVQAFLDWFLTSMRPRQSVKRQLGGTQDYAIYKKLLVQGLLTGEALARAEAACQSDRAMQGVGEQDESLDSLASGNTRLEREIEAMEKKLRLANDRNERLARLAQRQVATTDRQTERSQRQQDMEQFNEILVQTAPRDSRGRATPEQLLGRIQSTLRHLLPRTASASTNALVDASSSSSSLVVTSSISDVLSANSSSSEIKLREQPRKWKDFLYHHSMTRLQAQEERNLRTLQARIPAISAMTPTPRFQSSGEVSRQTNSSNDDIIMSPAPTSKRRDQGIPQPPSPWLHESDPAQLNMRDQDILLYNKCCVELERLRKAFVVGERDALLAQLQVTRYESHLRQLTSSRRQLLQQFQLTSRDAIWARKQTLQVSVGKTKTQLDELFQHTFPEKLEELAFLKSTSILLHSYEQKLWRQENRFVKLRLLLEGFEVQHARLRLVHRLLDSEREDLMQIDNRFQQLVALLRQHNESTEQRVRSYDANSGSDAARNTLSQTYLEEQDEVAHRLFEILERLVHAGDEQQIATHSIRLRTFDELVRLCNMKGANEQHHRETTVRVYDEWMRLYDSKRFTLNKLRHELFGDVTASTPMLLPVELSTALRHASETKDAAESGLEQALETLRLHRRSVQVEPSKRIQQERDIVRLQRELHEQ